MNAKWTCLSLLVAGFVLTVAEDASPKSSKVSDFKAKLAKTELAAKPPRAELLKTSDDDDFDNVSISELGISVPPEYANDTVQRDHHFYYNSTFYSNPEDAKKFWINLDDLPGNRVNLHDKLSDSYRQATTIDLSFDFPFYGSTLKKVTIATGGFLYMGDYLHNWIAATQYVAPLMANFDTRISNDSVIKYADNGTAFTVQWEKVYIQNRQSDGAFTFQATLMKNGDIVFAYKDIPFPVSSISDSQHPVKVGLSDAYILERSVFFVRRKTVYEYNRIHIQNWDISNNTALYFTALPTCNSFKDCSTCLASGEKLTCNWCEAVKRCSDGIDRERQSWVANGCTLSKTTSCAAATESTVTTTAKTEITIFTKKASEISKQSPGKFSTSKSSSLYNVDQSTISNDVFHSNEAAAHFMHEKESGTKQNSMSPGAIATVMLFLVALVSVSVWIFYAYKNPQSSSGQFLIKYRPSQWALKKESSGTTPSSHHV